MSPRGRRIGPRHTGPLGRSCKSGTTKPRPLRAGLFGDPRGQEHELNTNRVRSVGTLANPEKRRKQSKALTSSPTPFRKHEKQRGKKREWSENAGDARDLSHHHPPRLHTRPALPASQHATLQCLHLGVLTLSNQAQRLQVGKPRHGVGWVCQLPGPMLLVCSAMRTKDPEGSPQTPALSPQTRTASC